MLNKYKTAADKGLKWVLGMQKEDGSIRSAEDGMGYYKVPYLFNLAGRAPELHSLLSWIRDNYFTKEGDFNGEYPRDYYDFVYTYPNAWLICGSHRGGEFDLSQKGMDFLITQQDDAGGFYSHKDGKDGKQQDLMCTGMGGVAALYTGRIEIGKKVAELLSVIYEQQPAPEEAFYFVYKPEVGLVTDFPEDEAGLHVVYLAKDLPQWYFLPGLISGFLTLLYKSSNEEKYLSLAKKYLDFAFRCSDYQFNYGQVCKVGWGSAMLYSVTHDEKYRKMALRVADYFVNTQKNDGSWGSITERPKFKIVDGTAEFTVWLYEIVHYLS